jgi:hypothetical protein
MWVSWGMDYKGFDIRRMIIMILGVLAKVRQLWLCSPLARGTCVKERDPPECGKVG